MVLNLSIYFTIFKEGKMHLAIRVVYHVTSITQKQIHNDNNNKNRENTYRCFSKVIYLCIFRISVHIPTSVYMTMSILKSSKKILRNRLN